MNQDYSQRLDEILVDNFEEIRVIGCTVESIDRRIAEAKQAITSLIKELVAEAKPEIKAHPLGTVTLADCQRGLDQFEQDLLKAFEVNNENK